jgi:large subunit ribosomal protein L24
MLKVRKNDRVKVLSGADAGKVGRVLEIYPDENRVLVEHVHMIKRHTRPNPARQIKGGIAEREAPVNLSNVMVMCSVCNRPVRVKFEVQGGRKVRVCRKCHNVLDAPR